MAKRTYYFKRLHPDRTTFSIAAKEFFSMNGTINGAYFEFLKALNEWNRQGKGEWVYWEVTQEAYEEYRATMEKA